MSQDLRSFAVVHFYTSAPQHEPLPPDQHQYHNHHHDGGQCLVVGTKVFCTNVPQHLVAKVYRDGKMG